MTRTEHISILAYTALTRIFNAPKRSYIVGGSSTSTYKGILIDGNPNSYLNKMKKKLGVRGAHTFCKAKVTHLRRKGVEGGRQDFRKFQKKKKYKQQNTTKTTTNT